MSIKPQKIFKQKIFWSNGMALNVIVIYANMHVNFISHAQI